MEMTVHKRNFMYSQEVGFRRYMIFPKRYWKLLRSLVWLIVLAV